MRRAKRTRRPAGATATPKQPSSVRRAYSTWYAYSAGAGRAAGRLLATCTWWGRQPASRDQPTDSGCVLARRTRPRPRCSYSLSHPCAHTGTATCHRPGSAFDYSISTTHYPWPDLLLLSEQLLACKQLQILAKMMQQLERLVRFAPGRKPESYRELVACSGS